MTAWKVYTTENTHRIECDGSTPIGGNVVFFRYGERRVFRRKKYTVAVIPARLITAILRHDLEAA